MGKKDKTPAKKFIIKSNKLIEARYRLGLQELQVVFWLLGQIKHDDEDFKSHKLEIREFCNFIQVKPEKKYTELRKVTKNLMQRVMEIEEEDGDEIIQVAWLSSAIYKSKQGYVLLRFDPELKPYILQLKSHFTKINLEDASRLKSKYAIRVFELLLQYENIGSRNIAIIDLRNYCGIKEKEYKNYFDFKRKVIQKSKEEINQKTEYTVDYREIKSSRKVVAVEWSIKKKRVAIDPLRLSAPLSTLMERLTEYGFSKPLAARIVKNHEEAVIRNALETVDIQVSKGNAKNPKAMLQTALKEAWKP